MSQDLIIGIAGAGGDGVISAGESLITAAALEGYHGIMTKSFGSQIRGGEASCRLRLATQPVLNPNGPLDVAVALNWEDFRRFGAELPVESATIVIYESNTGVAPDKLPLEGVTPAVVFSVPITEMAEQHAGTDKAKNIVVTGLLAGWFGIGRESMLAGIRKKFAKKGAAVVEGNVRAFQAGLDFAEAHPLKEDRKLAAPQAGRQSQAADGRQRYVRGGGDFCRLHLFRRLPHHALDGDHAVSRPRDLEVWRDASCRRRMKSRASARWWGRRSPARRR